MFVYSIYWLLFSYLILKLKDFFVFGNLVVCLFIVVFVRVGYLFVFSIGICVIFIIFGEVVFDFKLFVFVVVDYNLIIMLMKYYLGRFLY